MRTTTTAAELDEAIAFAREAASALVKATREGASPERIAELRAISKAAERRVGPLTT